MAKGVDVFGAEITIIHNVRLVNTNEMESFLRFLFCLNRIYYYLPKLAILLNVFKKNILLAAR